MASDITDPHSAEALVAACVAAFGGLHVAFNNAGIVGHVRPPVADADVEVFDRVIATNVRGTWLSMKYEVPAILAPGDGAIINRSSGAGLRGGPRSSVYHAIIGMTLCRFKT